MIILGIKNENGVSPERVLTEKEKKSVTSSLFNGVNYINYQGDEPPKVEQPYVEPVEEKTEQPLTDEQLIQAFNRLKELGVIQ